ncbi:MAG: twin-arginine translocation signal domain-containing protein, partial [Planctomycetaceae bacterium]|nr:twin-arginine translocation signal domain-containing protein [Planctomycetaceae bacterium]
MSNHPQSGSSRRQFLKTSAATIAATATAPMFLNAADKSGSKEVILGNGKDHVYRCIHNWGNDSLPESHKYSGPTHGVAVDSAGLVYITHYGTPGSIFVFDGDGKFVRSMGEVHAKNGRGSGHGIDIRKEGKEEFIYLAPSESSLSFTKMTLDGEVVWQTGKEKLSKDSGVWEGKKLGYRPTNTSFRPDGGYYLGDGYGSNYIFEYDKNDKFVQTLGGTGTADGKFKTPHGQWLDNRDGVPKLVVADRANKRLQWFGLDGKHIKTLGGFLFPADIDTQGDLMLVPDLHARITLLDLNNEVIAQLGDDEAWRSKVLDGKVGMRTKPALWQP